MKKEMVIKAFERKEVKYNNTINTFIRIAENDSPKNALYEIFINAKRIYIYSHSTIKDLKDYKCNNSTKENEFRKYRYNVDIANKQLFDNWYSSLNVTE